MADHSKRTGAAIEAHYQFLTWLMPTVEKFPRSHKFTLGDRIENAALDVLEALIEATAAGSHEILDEVRGAVERRAQAILAQLQESHHLLSAPKTASVGVMVAAELEH